MTYDRTHHHNSAPEQPVHRIAPDEMHEVHELAQQMVLAARAVIPYRPGAERFMVVTVDRHLSATPFWVINRAVRETDPTAVVTRCVRHDEATAVAQRLNALDRAAANGPTQAAPAYWPKWTGTTTAAPESMWSGTTWSGTIWSGTPSARRWAAPPTRRKSSASHVFTLAGPRRTAGKTTTAINLGACLAGKGMETLVVDLDPQCATTRGLGVSVGPEPSAALPTTKTRGHQASIYELLVSDTVSTNAVIVREVLPHLALLPASEALSAAESELASIPACESRLKRILDGISTQYDFVLIDPPTYLAGLLYVNALTAADGVILALPCAYVALADLAANLKMIKTVRARLNPRLDLSGVVLTRYEQHNTRGTRRWFRRCADEGESDQVVQEVRELFSRELFESIVPCDDHLVEAARRGHSILQYASRSPSARAYKALAREVIRRVKEKAPAA